MNNKFVSSVHIEWTPGRIQAMDVATSETASGTRLAELAPLLSKHRHAIVGVGRGMVFLKTLRLPKAGPEDLRRILDVQIGQFFPLPAHQLAYDFVQTNDQTADGCLTLLAAMRADDLKQIRSALQQAGITATCILPIALGSPIVAARSGFADALVVEQTPGGLALDVVQGGILRFSRTAPANSDALSEAQRTLSAANAGDLPLVATRGAELPGAIPAQGTALQWLHEAAGFHFELAEDRAREVAKKSSARVRMTGLLLASAVLLDILVWADRSDSLAVLKRGEGAWARQLSQLRSIRTTETDKAQKISVMQSTLTRAFHPAQPVSDVVSLVGDSLPPNAWLTGMTVERGKPLQIRGTAKSADDVSLFVRKLGSTPRFRDVKLAFANSARIDKQPIVQFNVTAFAVGNLPMPTPVKKTGRTAAKKTTTPADPSATGAQQ